MPEMFEDPSSRLVLVFDDPGIPSGQIHDPYAGLSEELTEAGKAIGTSQLKANVGARDRFILDNRTHGEVRRAIQLAARRAGSQLRDVYSETRTALANVLFAWQAGVIRRTDARQQASRLLREAYERVRDIARRASGLSRLGYDPAVFREEEKWFRDAVREEIGYFHAFMEDIRQGRVDESAIERRVDAYVRALRFMYEAARVQAMPSNVLLYWIGPRKANDPNVCDGCEYMMERSPFPKDVLPATPRDGSTRCLTNCRHRIQVRVVQNMNDVVRRRSILERRDKMVRKLRQLKEQAGLGRRTPRTTARERNPFRGDRMTTRVAPRRRRRRRR